jgi:hypothetical protein
MPLQDFLEGPAGIGLSFDLGLGSLATLEVLHGKWW